MYRRARNFYDTSDGVTRIVAIAAMAILLVVTLPTLMRNAPLVSNGVACSGLSTVSGNGTNQSLRKPDAGALRLEIFGTTSYIAGQAFELDVRLTNDSSAPMVILFVAAENVFRWTARENGLSFWVQSANGQVLGEPGTVRSPPPNRQQYPAETLRVLGPFQHCTDHFTIDAQRLAAAGVRNGQYRLVAVYRNVNKGNLSPVGALTPTPVFRDQGVYITENDGVRSNTMTVTVAAAAAP